MSAVDVSPWALREGIILHYLQARLNETFALPLSPLQSAASQRSMTLSRSSVSTGLVT